VKGIFGCVFAALFAVAACGAAQTIDAVNNPSDDSALKHCRDLANAAHEGGADASDAYAQYVACTKDAGF